MLPGQVFMDAARAVPREVGLLPPDREAEYAPLAFWSRQDVPPFLPTEVAKEPVAFAQVNHCRWIIICPLCGLGAQYASRTDHRFFCVSCLNEKAGARWLSVVWPLDPGAIETLLRPRPTEHGSWTPTETLADLLAENETHKVGI